MRLAGYPRPSAASCSRCRRRRHLFAGVAWNPAPRFGLIRWPESSTPARRLHRNAPMRSGLRPDIKDQDSPTLQQDTPALQGQDTPALQGQDTPALQGQDTLALKDQETLTLKEAAAR